MRVRNPYIGAMTHRLVPSPRHSRTGFVGVLLTGTLALSVVLAYQAIAAGHSHKQVAMRVVKEQALFAAWEFSARARFYIAEAMG